MTQCILNHTHTNKLDLFISQLAGCLWLDYFSRVPFWNRNVHQTVSEHTC